MEARIRFLVRCEHRKMSGLDTYENAATCPHVRTACRKAVIESAGMLGMDFYQRVRVSRAEAESVSGYAQFCQAHSDTPSKCSFGASKLLG